MTSAELLVDAFGRVREVVHQVVDGLTPQGWAGRFGLPLGPLATGYGHRADDVAAVRVASGELLVSYYDAVDQQTNLTGPRLVVQITTLGRP
jgi:hypothetical protein